LATQEKKVMGILVLGGDVLDLIVELKQALDLVRNEFERAQNVRALLGSKHANAAHEQSKKRKDCDLGNKRLCGSDTNFGTGMKINAPIRLTSDGAANDVADTKDLVPTAFCFP
jgi:hypothetical protein